MNEKQYKTLLFVNQFTSFNKNKKISSSGLGMYICNNLVNLLDGNINIESFIDVGTKVTVKIKNALQQNDMKKSKSFSSIRNYVDLTITDKDKNSQIIVCDDKLINRKILGNMLTISNKEYIECENGKQVLDILKAEKQY